MINKKIARRYARALIEIGKENDQIEQFKNELNTFFDLVEKFSDLEKSLSNPLYSTEDLKQIVSAITGKINISNTVQNFLFLLIDKRRIQYLADIIELYEDLTDEFFGYVRARIVSATLLSNADCENIKKSLEKITQKKILLKADIEPEIIGGVIAEVGDRVFDGSIRKQLQKIGETLT